MESPWSFPGQRAMGDGGPWEPSQVWFEYLLRKYSEAISVRMLTISMVSSVAEFDTLLAIPLVLSVVYLIQRIEPKESIFQNT